MLAVINLLPLFISWTAPLGHLWWEGCVVSLITVLHYFYIWMHQTGLLPLRFAYTEQPLQKKQKQKRLFKGENDQSASIISAFKAVSAVTEHRRGYFTQHLSRFGPVKQIPNRACIWHWALFICLVYTFPGGSPCSWSPCMEFTFLSWSEWMQSCGDECTICIPPLRHKDENTFIPRHLGPDLLSKE